MSEFRVEVVGERRLLALFESFPEEMRAALVAAMTSITNELYARVLGAAPERTGALRALITQRVIQGKDFVRGEVSVSGDGANAGAAARKAAALEYGAHKAVSVASYSRRHDHVFAHKIPVMTVTIAEAYQRRVNIVERRFLRGPLEEMHGEILARLQAAVEERLAEAA